MKIIYTNELGGVSIISPADSVELALKDVPDGAQYEIVEDSSIPHDRAFRDAWEKSGNAISHNIAKVKEIAHKKRRIARAEEFAPLDIKATIPAEATAAETARQVVRDKYAAMQIAIDAAGTVDEIKAALL